LPVELKGDPTLRCGRVAGAATVTETEAWLAEAGFVDVRVTPKAESRELISSWAPGYKHFVGERRPQIERLDPYSSAASSASSSTIAARATLISGAPGFISARRRASINPRVSVPSPQEIRAVSHDGSMRSRSTTKQRYRRLSVIDVSSELTKALRESHQASRRLLEAAKTGDSQTTRAAMKDCRATHRGHDSHSRLPTYLIEVVGPHQRRSYIRSPN
jgi:hypothetical protein